jgi:hypothetical protein
LGSERGVVNGEGESRPPAGCRHLGEPDEEPRREAIQQDPGHPVRQADGAGFSNLAEIVEE